MRDAPEVVRQVGINDFPVTKEQRLFHLDHRLLGIAAPPVGVLFRWKVGLEDRIEHQHCCCHAHPIAQGGNSQRPEFAVVLADEHSSYRVRLVVFLRERKRQFPKPRLHAIRLDIRKVLSIPTRCATVGAALGPGVSQDILAVDLVVQGVETKARLCLRFRVQRRL